MSSIDRPPLQLGPLELGITAQSRLLAQRCAAQQTTDAKRQQVYLNTLAIAVVQGYLHNLAIATEPSPDAFALQEWQHVMNQTLGNGADLYIQDWGVLACRPVLAKAGVCAVPPGDYAGCVAVQFDAAFHYATLIGFKSATALPSHEEQLIPLEEFQDFDVFLDQVPETVLEISPSASTPAPAETQPLVTRLQDWLEGTIPALWQRIDDLLGTQAPPLVAVRSPSGTVERGKILVLDGETDPVALVVWVEPTLTSELEIAVELWPINAQHHLPELLQLQLLDATSSIAIMQAQARGSDRLQFTFTGEPGDGFNVKVTHKDVTIIEAFVI